MPEKLKNVLKQDIDHLKEDFDKKQAEENSRIEMAIENRDLETLEKIMKKIKELGDDVQNFSKIRTFIRNEYNDLERQIKECLKDNDLSSAFKHWKTLNEYKKFSENNLNFNLIVLKEYKNLQYQLSHHLLDLIETVSKFIQYNEQTKERSHGNDESNDVGSWTLGRTILGGDCGAGSEYRLKRQTKQCHYPTVSSREYHGSVKQKMPSGGGAINPSYCCRCRWHHPACS